jgi:uncharacterized protein YecE (DUF72 family)
MWTHKAWPAPGSEKLRAYAERCTAVEGNTTFYATPSRATVATWAQQTSPDFRFVMKVPRVVTHEQRLAGGAAELHRFLDAIEPLGPRVHSLWVQLPASFGPNDLPVLQGFLRRLPASHRSSVEVRHPAFFDAATGALERTLATVNAEWVPFDTTAFFAKPPTSEAERDAWNKKPRRPRRTTALTEYPIVRYLGRDDPEETVAGWSGWVDTAVAWLRDGRSPTVFIHTPDNVEAPELARRFHEQVRRRLPQLESLPANEPLTLF